VIATVTLAPESAGTAIVDLRYKLAWQGLHLDKVFHATTDPQAVRDEVFGCLEAIPFRVDATIDEPERYERTA
jgi:hypothetical protein